jgi:hypothetical protein
VKLLRMYLYQTDVCLSSLLHLQGCRTECGATHGPLCECSATRGTFVSATPLHAVPTEPHCLIRVTCCSQWPGSPSAEQFLAGAPPTSPFTMHLAIVQRSPIVAATTGAAAARITHDPSSTAVQDTTPTPSACQFPCLLCCLRCCTFCSFRCRSASSLSCRSSCSHLPAALPALQATSCLMIQPTHT